MKKIVFFLLITSVFGYSQKTPRLIVGKKEVKLASLKVKVNISGTLATTTFDMNFYNSTNNVLEGELKFPLGENQEISRLALEMNGKLREGVVVEKELGRIAFEGIVRRGVDPALLERGNGTYNVRVYPIPARGYKRVVITYEQELVYKDNAYYYQLPLDFKQQLDKFMVVIEVVNQDRKPILVKGDETLDFSSWKNSYKTSFEKEYYQPQKDILIKLPFDTNDERLILSDNYFYFNKMIKVEQRKREKPKTITLFWDTSLSLENRNLKKEIQFFDAYFKNLKNVEIQFITFSNEITKNNFFSIKNGEWSSLKKELENTVYDGSTSYNFVNHLGQKSDVIFLASDGITTTSNPLFQSNKPVFIINSKTTSNHQVLKKIAKKTRGTTINLNTASISEALQLTSILPFEYLGYESENKNIEIYHSQSSKELFNFSVSGKSYNLGDKITFFFGYIGTVTHKKTITLNAEVVNSDKFLQRIWAKNKLSFLREDIKSNKKEIIDLATEFGLVTKFTSLIVLENVRDYVKYNIEPPKELMDEYKLIQSNTKRYMTLVNSISEIIDDRVQVVEDEKEIEETVIESTQTDRMESFDIDEIVEVEEIEEVVEDVPFMMIEEAPTFSDCSGSKEERKSCFNQKITQHINDNFNLEFINDLGLSSGRQRIFIQFTISKKGKVENVKIRAPHRKIKTEIIKVIKSLPQMIPARQNGKSVSVKFLMPLIINIEGYNDDTTTSITNDPTPNLSSSAKNKLNFKTYKGSLKITDRTFKTPYITALSFFKNKEDAYSFYITQRESYKTKLYYYIDVSDYFLKIFNDDLYAARILSNVAELNVDSYEFLRAYAYKLEERNKKAVFIYQKILELRPEDAQSYRDLALAYQNVGLCQKAFDLFFDIVSKKIYENNKHRRVFKGLQDIATQEMRLLIQKYKDDLDLDNIPKEYLKDTEKPELRIVVDWNHNDTDIDLHIIDPNLEECFYKHKNTFIGGKMSTDMTQGFGPESYTLEKAIKGNYYVKIKYFGDRKQRIASPTFMKVTIYKNQGKKDEEKKVQVIRLSKENREEIIEKIVI